MCPGACTCVRIYDSASINVLNEIERPAAALEQEFCPTGTRGDYRWFTKGDVWSH